MYYKNKQYKNEHRCFKASLLSVITFGLKIWIESFPVFFIMINVVGIAHGVSNGFITFYTQKFYDSVTNVLTQNEPLSKVYLMIAILGMTFICKEVLNGVHNFMYDIAFTKIDGKMSNIIHDKIARIDPVCFEDATLYDDINKSVEGAKTISFIIGMGMTLFTFYLPYFIFMAIYLHYIKPKFVYAIIFVFVPVLLSQFIRTSIIAKFEDEATPIRRQYEYYYKTMTDREYFKETRILGAYSFFLKYFTNNLKKLGKAELKANRKANLFELFMGVLSAVGYASIAYMLVVALLDGEITVGAFAAVFNSIALMFSMMGEMINKQIGHIASDLGKAYNFMRFIEMPERGGEDCSPTYDAGIIAKNVSFKYPNAENESIDNVSLEIKQGETVAIVGENGAGKSTLIRLLMGMYMPTEGRVTINGMDTVKANNKSICQGVSGVFQRYQRYQMTLKENIQISDCNSVASIDEALKQAGVELEGRSFPDGTSTMLSREFGGVDLSGGQWQRIAIARGLYRIHDVIVLDEPTASIDPVQESYIYRKFIEISKNKTAIIVTHRLGSTKMADRVIVMSKGKIINSGSHQELMQEGGLYAEMFNSQASWYNERIGV